MGPVVILDKSTFQGLSRNEHFFLEMYFEQNLIPILAMEVLGDLAKEGRGGGGSKLKELASKFTGSGPVTNEDYRNLCLLSLLGASIPMDGSIVPASSAVSYTPDGTGMLINLSPFNQAIIRWSQGDYLEFEHQVSRLWRIAARWPKRHAFRAQLDRHAVIIPRVDRLEELGPIADSLLLRVGLQDVWFEWLLEGLLISGQYKKLLRDRWKRRPRSLLRDCAPYAFHCVRVMLFALIADKYCLVEWRSTNVLDIQYLLYLPFCQAFLSDDVFHRQLAPLLLRTDQDFVEGSEMKRDLSRLAKEMGERDDLTKQKLAFALGAYPPPAKNSVVWEIWKRHCKPWRPGMGSFLTDLSEEDQADAIRVVERMFIDVEGDRYFDGSR